MPTGTGDILRKGLYPIDFGDGLAVLHTPAGLVDIFDDAGHGSGADQAALYAGATHTPDAIRDFVAYGGPAGEDDDVAVAAGLWSEGSYTADTEQIPGGEALAPGGSLGRHAETLSNGLDDWVVYTPGGTTPGAPNPAPAPFFRTPPDGILTTDHRIPFGWSTVPGAAGYQFQLASGASPGPPPGSPWGGGGGAR